MVCALRAVGSWPWGLDWRRLTAVSRSASRSRSGTEKGRWSGVWDLVMGSLTLAGVAVGPYHGAIECNATTAACPSRRRPYCAQPWPRPMPRPSSCALGFAGLRDRGCTAENASFSQSVSCRTTRWGPEAAGTGPRGAVPVLVSPFQHYPPRAASAIGPFRARSGSSARRWSPNVCDGRPTRRAVPAQARQGRQACGVQGVHCREHESGTCENSRAAPASRRRESKRRAHSEAV